MKRKAGALVFAVDLFEEDAIDAGHGEFADEELPGERPEFAAGVVEHEVGRTHPHLAIGQPDGGRFVDRHAALDLGNGDALDWLRRLGEGRAGQAAEANDAWCP